MGTYEHSLDAKGRVIIPSKFREALGETFVIAPGLDGCLFAYPEEKWVSFVEKMEAIPGSKDVRNFQRRIMSGAASCELDKQGRTLIPPNLRMKFGLEKDVVLVGVMSKIEIWSKERWDEIDDDADMDEIAEHMAEFGLNY